MRSERPLIFFFNDTATSEIYTLSLHDALPIFWRRREARSLEECIDVAVAACRDDLQSPRRTRRPQHRCIPRSEEHTSELQSHLNIVCRLLLEKKKNNIMTVIV